MRHRKGIALLIVAMVFAVGIWTAQAASLVEVHAVLAGEVVSVVPVGTSVGEGAELVRVATLAGSATAARATARGIVREVLVHQGSAVKSGDVVVRIETE